MLAPAADVLTRCCCCCAGLTAEVIDAIITAVKENNIKAILIDSFATAKDLSILNDENKNGEVHAFIKNVLPICQVHGVTVIWTDVARKRNTQMAMNPLDASDIRGAGIKSQLADSIITCEKDAEGRCAAGWGHCAVCACSAACGLNCSLFT